MLSKCDCKLQLYFIVSLTRNLRTQNIYKIEQPGLKTIGLGSGCVAQLVERSLQIPEVRGSNPFIGKILLNICLLSTVY